MASLLFGAKSLDFGKICDPRCWGSGEFCHLGVNMLAIKKKHRVLLKQMFYTEKGSRPSQARERWLYWAFESHSFASFHFTLVPGKSQVD